MADFVKLFSEKNHITPANVSDSIGAFKRTQLSACDQAVGRQAFTLRLLRVADYMRRDVTQT